MDDRIEAEMIALLPRLRRFAFALTGSWADADDLVQTTCERAIERLDQWRVGTRLDSWMYRIAQTQHLNARRREQTRRRHLDETAARMEGQSSAPRAIDRLALGEVDRALAGLPAEQRMVLLLVVVEGRGYDEVAEILDVPFGTVASRLYRARAALSARLNGDGRDD